MSDLSDREMRAAFRQSRPDSSILRRLGIVTPVHRAPEGDSDSAGRYLIGEEIARGGLGVVFRGHDIDLGRDVAMKVLREEYRDDAAVTARFVEEAQIGGQLQHPGVAPVYEFGIDERDRPYFAMKLIKGHTLAELIENADESRVGYLAVFEKLCQTMAYAHARGVVHRDLKPANVMVGAFGEVQVVDWGFAKVLSQGELEDEKRGRDLSVIASPRSSESSESEAGSIFGTPAYMPPEQALGQLELVDERSDVFALGAVLYELLTGAPPYVGDDRLLRAARVDVDLAPLEAHPPALAALARDCLAASPGDRPRNAEVVADRVAQYVASEDERAKQARIARERTRIRARSEKKKRRLTLAVVACVLATGSVGALAWAATDQAEQRARAANDRAARFELAEANHLWGRGDAIGAYTAVRRSRAIADSPGAARLEHQLREAAEAEEARLQREALDRGLTTRLSGIVDGWQIETEREFLAERFSEAFAAAEIDPFTAKGRRYMATQPQETRELWANALAVWAVYEPDANADRRRALLEVADQIDPDEWRAAIRTAGAAADIPAIRRLAHEVTSHANVTDYVLSLQIIDRYEMWHDNLVDRVTQAGLARFPDSLRLLVVAAHRGAWDRRRALLLAALARAPHDVGITTRVVQAFRDSEPETGVEIANAAIQRLGPKRDILLARAGALARAGRHQESLEEVRKFPNDPAFRSLEVYLVWLAGSSGEELLELRRRNVEDFPEAPHVWWELCWEERINGEAAEARRVALRGLELHPGNNIIFRGLACAEVLLENWDAAIRIVEAIPASERFEDGRAALAIAYWESGNKERARKLARSLPKRAPEPLVRRARESILGE